jgi:hypothetical protein
LLNLFGDENEQPYEENTSLGQLSDKAIVKDESSKEISSNEKGNIHMDKQF